MYTYSQESDDKSHDLEGMQTANTQSDNALLRQDDYQDLSHLVILALLE